MRDRVIARETDGAELTFASSKTEGGEEALVALDLLGTVDATAVCRWSCELSEIKARNNIKPSLDNEEQRVASGCP